MRILVNGATLAVERFAGSPHMGALVTSGAKNSIQRIVELGMPYAIDNGAASKDGFDASAFLRLLSRAQGIGRCLFVAAPDVVRVEAGEFIGDASGTLDQFAVWEPTLHDRGFPVALVAQDGLEQLPIPWSKMDALFVGGSTRWKLSAAAFDLCRQAKARGLHVHVGRVNSRRRIVRCIEMGADTIDGSHFTRWPDTHIPIGLRWVRDEVCQGRLFPVKGTQCGSSLASADNFAS